MSIWAIVPIKPLRASKSRLAGILSPGQRAAVTRRLLVHTLEVLRQAPGIQRTLVVSRDRAALKLARELDAQTLNEGSRPDLNLAVTRGAHVAAAQAATAVLVLPIDLPLLSLADISALLDPLLVINDQARNTRVMIISPDRHRAGTNALLLQPATGFPFAFGVDSYRRHLALAEQLEMSTLVVERQGLGFDVDTPADWRLFQSQQPAENRDPGRLSPLTGSSNP